MKKRTLAYICFILLCSMLYSPKHVLAENINSSIPSIPNDFQGVDLKSSFYPAIGNGILYSDNNDVLQMSSDYYQVGALWGKIKLI